LEARFIILHPDDPGKILLATSLIRCLKNQVEEALVYSIVKEKHQWLLESNPHQEELFVYREKAGELLEELKDFLPDYLIDLDGGKEVRQLKNRLKVLDFTIKKKFPWNHWEMLAFNTCKLFDVQNDGMGSQFFAKPLDPHWLPSAYLNGYLVLSLDAGEQGHRDLSDDQIIEWAVMTEKPIVVTGNASDRDLANRIGQSTGCAVFPTCGDRSPSQIASLMGASKGTIVFDPFWGQIASGLGLNHKLLAGKPNLFHPDKLALWARSLFN
jgi:ADP-heptose:LPS heptosyltransferase